MDLDPPVLTVLLFASVAAALAALGALPLALGWRTPRGVVGAAYALAAGLMLGAGYLLALQGLEVAATTVIVGSTLGVAYTAWVQWIAGTGAFEPPRETPSDAPPSAPGVLQSTLHAAAEGVAIGAAMAWNLRLGVFVALALALHNVGEALALADGVGKEVSPLRAAGLAVLTNVPQPLLGVFVFALAPAFPAGFPAVLGFAAGALVYLVLTELVPSAYALARPIVVALLVSASLGGVVLLESLVV